MSEFEEIDALKTAVEAIAKLDDPESRTRVVTYLLAKFGGTVPPATKSAQFSAGHIHNQGQFMAREIPGIACIQEDGSFKLTIRDLKATSTTNAATRVAMVAIHAYEQLTSDKQTSSKKVVVPSLREYRVYDSNTRTALARNKGIIRKGDLLSLDAHAKQEAEQYVKEILDPEHQGTWTPRTSARKRGKVKSKDQAG